MRIYIRAHGVHDEQRLALRLLERRLGRRLRRAHPGALRHGGHLREEGHRAHRAGAAGALPLHVGAAAHHRVARRESACGGREGWGKGSHVSTPGKRGWHTLRSRDRERPCVRAGQKSARPRDHAVLCFAQGRRRGVRAEQISRQNDSDGPEAAEVASCGRMDAHQRSRRGPGAAARPEAREGTAAFHRELPEAAARQGQSEEHSRAAGGEGAAPESPAGEWCGPADKAGMTTTTLSARAAKVHENHPR